MSIKYLLLLTILYIFANSINGVKQRTIPQKSKLCGDTACTEVLFKTRVKRVMGINNDAKFLKLTENGVIEVVAIKFSDRPDIMEGKLQDGSRGFFYSGAIDRMPYAEFLRSAIEMKKELNVISQNNEDIGSKRLLGVVHSETDLVRDYNSVAVEAAAAEKLPAPELLPIPEPVGGHGHSHSHGHGHSHSHGHGHSHTHEEVKKDPPVKVEEPKKSEEPKVEATEAPIAADKDKKESSLSMDEEIELLIAKETELIMKNEVKATNPSEAEKPPEAVQHNIVEEKPKVAQIYPKITIPTTTQSSVEVPPASTPPTTNDQVTPPINVVNEPVTTPMPIVTEPPKMEEVPPQDVKPTGQVPVTTEQVTSGIPITPETANIPQDPTPSPIVADIPVVNEKHAEATHQQPSDAPTPVVEEPIHAEVPPPVVTQSPPVETPKTEEVPQDPIQNAVPVTDSIPVDSSKSEALPTSTPIPDNMEDFIKKYEAEKAQENVVPEAVDKPKAYEDAYGDRFKDLANESQRAHAEPLESAGIFNFVRSTFNLGNVSDATIGIYLNLTFVLASLAVFLIMNTLSSNQEPEKFDRMAYFNLVTKHKELEMQLKQKNAEFQKVQSMPAQSNVSEKEVLDLKNQVSMLQSQLSMAANQRAELEQTYNQMRESDSIRQQEMSRLVAEYEAKIEKASLGGFEASKELDVIKAQLNESQQTVLARQQEFMELQNEKSAIQAQYEQSLNEIRDCKEEIEELSRKNEELIDELKIAKIENSRLLDTVQQYEEKAQNEGSAAESGGSGWSDFGDNDDFETEKKVEKADENTPDQSQVSLAELAELKAKYQKFGEDLEQMDKLKEKLHETEKELKKYKMLYEEEEKLKMQIELKSKRMEEDVVEAKKKVEDMEAEKKESAERMNEMLKMLNSTMSKSGETDKLISSLREEGFSKDKQLLEAEVSLRKKSDKIDEMDKELKRLKNEYAKLEMKSFHEVMNLKKKLDDFQTSQILSSSTMPKDIFNGPNLIGADLSQRRVDMASPLDDPIWDEPDYTTQRSMPAQESYFSSGSMTLPSKKRNSRRSDQRMLADNSPSDRDEKKKKDSTHRRRSRSHGRQPHMYADPFGAAPYLPGSSDSSFMSQGPGMIPLSGRHSKSGHLHYSSGGSNNGRSPPPEMPLLSAVPPPGVRKPPTKRIDPNVQ